jgi:hypothetical protein
VPGAGPIGRQKELTRVDEFLAAVPTALRALVLTGPGGIGNTTVWAEGVRRAGERGFAVLSARPNGAETRLSYAGLADPLQRQAVFRPLRRQGILERYALKGAR